MTRTPAKHPVAERVWLPILIAILCLFIGKFVSDFTSSSGAEAREKMLQDFSLEQVRMSEQLKSIGKELQVLNANDYKASDAARDFSLRDDRANTTVKRLDAAVAEVADLTKRVAALESNR
jgi:hypothetical protein